MKKLRAAVHAELKPIGTVQTFLVDRIADLLGEYDTAESGKLKFDPLRKSQDEILETVFAALRELSLQTRGRRAKRK